MCFSASASFTASAILAAAGVATTRKITKPSQRMFALIPVVFSLHQFTEGCVWLTFNNPELAAYRQIPVYIFLVIAQVIWPVWVPLSIALMEKKPGRKQLFRLLIVLGSLISLYHAWCILFFPVNAEITTYHVHYYTAFPFENFLVIGTIYVITIVVPPFISSVKRMIYVGILTLSSFLVTLAFFRDDVVSVWCFFAAMISGIVFAVMRELKQHTGTLKFKNAGAGKNLTEAVNLCQEK